MPQLITLLLVAVALVGLTRLGLKLLAEDDTGPSLRQLPPVPAVAVGAALLVAGLALGALQDTADSFDIVANTTTTPATPATEGIDPLVAPHIDPAFMTWLERRIQPDERFAMVCGTTPCGDTQRFFSTARLAPRVR